MLRMKRPSRLPPHRTLTPSRLPPHRTLTPGCARPLHPSAALGDGARQRVLPEPRLRLHAQGQGDEAGKGVSN